MAKLTIGERSFEIAPFKLRELRLAAPHIDAINDVAGALTTFEGLTQSARSIIEVLAIGIQKIDPSVTADALEDMLGMEDMVNLQVALTDVMEESGLAKKGEAPASAPMATEAAALESSSSE